MIRHNKQQSAIQVVRGMRIDHKARPAPTFATVEAIAAVCRACPDFAGAMRAGRVACRGCNCGKAVAWIDLDGKCPRNKWIKCLP